MLWKSQVSRVHTYHCWVGWYKTLHGFVKTELSRLHFRCHSGLFFITCLRITCHICEHLSLLSWWIVAHYAHTQPWINTINRCNPFPVVQKETVCFHIFQGSSTLIYLHEWKSVFVVIQPVRGNKVLQSVTRTQLKGGSNNACKATGGHAVGSKANSMDHKAIVAPGTECLHCKSSLTHVSTPLSSRRHGKFWDTNLRGGRGEGSR